jgi:hypothetical protein
MLRSKALVLFLFALSSMLLVAGLCGAYWAKSLQREGHQVTTTVLSRESSPSSKSDGSSEVKVLMRYEETGMPTWERTEVLIGPVRVGTVTKIYMLYGNRGMSGSGNDSIPGDWNYAWLLPLSNLTISIILLIYAFRLKRPELGFPLRVGAIVVVVACFILLQQSFGRILEIRDYVVRQRINNLGPIEIKR